MANVISLSGSHERWFGGHREQVVPYHRMYGKQYCLPSFIAYEQAELAELCAAAETMDRLFWKVMRFVQRYVSDESLSLQLGIPAKLIPVARMEVPFHGIARQDWILNEQGMKLIEYNTDTPTGVPESAWLAGSLLEQMNAEWHNPSLRMNEHIVRAFAQLYAAFHTAGYRGSIYFACATDHLEDRGNTYYLYDLLRKHGYNVEFVALQDLSIIPGDGLFVRGQRIEMLYRLYPLEYLVNDRDAEGYPIGQALLELVEQGKCVLINPTQSILTQSKGMLALIWSLVEQNKRLMKWYGLREPLFDEAECAAIQRWMLPAYWQQQPFVERAVPYVSKGFFGREGKGTTIYTETELLTSSMQDASEDHYYQAQPQVYQQYEPMRSLSVETEQGLYTGYLLTGVFVIGGRYAGILPRIGERITGDLAYYCAAVSAHEIAQP